MSRASASAARVTRGFAKRMVRGPQFRHLAPHSTPAPNTERLRVAIPYLIPNLGDTVMVFPLIDAIRAANPDAEIVCFTHGGGRILSHHPAVDRSYEFTYAPRNVSLLGRADYILALYRWWNREFREQHFHSVPSFRGGVDPFHSAHLGWMLGGHDRIGFSGAVEPERLSFDLEPEPLFTDCIRSVTRIHEVDRGSQILERSGLIGAPVDIRKPVQSMLSIAARDEARDIIASYPHLSQPYAIVAPGSSFPRRRWEALRFAEVARRCFLSRGWKLVFVGGPEDIPLCALIADTLSTRDAINLAGKTSFSQLAAIAAGAQCFLGNDSGTGHVAGATGTPCLVVAQFRMTGPETHHSSPLRTHPVGPFVRIVQPPQQLAPCVEECEQDVPHCILSVTVDNVCDAMEQLLKDVSQEQNRTLC